MKGISLRILFAIVLSLMCILFGAGHVGFNGVTVVAAYVNERTDKAVLEREFKIKYGQELTVKREDLKVKFVSVQGDSRCPIDATCHWAGDAKILISVRGANAEEARMEFHTLGAQPGKYQEYVIRLIALYPSRRVGVEVKPSDYVATLLIKKK